MRISFDCYVTAYSALGSDAPLDEGQCRAAGLDGLEETSSEIAPFFYGESIADLGIIDAGTRFWIDSSGYLRATVSFLSISELSAEQLRAISEELVGQLLDGAGEDQVINTRSGPVMLDWLHRGGDFVRSFDLTQTDDGAIVPDLRPPISLRPAAQGNMTALRAALDGGCAPDARGRWGMTALMCAASGGHEDCLELLLARGADVNLASSETGNTALGLAAMQGHEVIVRRLLAAGADTSLGDKPALHWAANRHHIQICKFLLGAGVNPMAVDGSGETALFLTSDPAIVGVLIDGGVAPAFRNPRGETALDHAVSQAESFEGLDASAAANWRAVERVLRRYAI